MRGMADNLSSGARIASCERRTPWSRWRWPSGVLYPMLTRMLDEGWVEDGWEDRTTIREKRPPRRYYVLTDKGRLAL
jgi:DNA-binding PadR family transcriptional regulator